jgi:phosphatidylglycerophosphate synthase
MQSRYRALRPGLAVGPHTNNQDFWDIVFGRPSAVLLLVLVGGLRWVTPNLLTVLSLVLKFAVAALVLWGDHAAWLWAAALLQLSCTFDCADGQLARYRKLSSVIGGYLDKIVDSIGFLFLFAAMAEVCARQTGHGYYPHLAGLTIFALTMSGYVKWITVAEVLQRGGSSAAVTSRTARDVKWWHIPLKLAEFNEGDLHLWIGIALCIGELPWVMWLLAGTQTAMVIAAIVYRGLQLVRADAPDE